jgi:hypothetical protein
MAEVTARNYKVVAEATGGTSKTISKHING